jgi:hypothetical protein
VPLLWLAIVLLSIFNFVESPQLQALLSDIARPALRDASFAAYFTLAFGVGSLWVALYGWVIDALGETAGLPADVLADGAAFVAAAAGRAAHPRRRQRIAEQRRPTTESRRLSCDTPRCWTLRSQPEISRPLLNLADFEALAASDGARDVRLHRRRRERRADAGRQPTAWQRWRLRPRVLVDVSTVDTSTRLLGSGRRLPVGSRRWPSSTRPPRCRAGAGARGGARRRPVLPLDDVQPLDRGRGAAADEAGGGPRWFQLYVHRDRDRSADLVRRAAAAGYGAIVLTVDFPVAGRRERDLRNQLPYPQAYGNFELPTRRARGARCRWSSAGSTTQRSTGPTSPGCAA